MSKIFILFVVFSAVAVFLERATGAAVMDMEESQEEAGSSRVRRQAVSSSLGDYPLEDVELLQPLFRTPLKRQWCRRGMAYNPALGTCTFSVAAMRGRGRNHRRH